MPPLYMTSLDLCREHNLPQHAAGQGCSPGINCAFHVSKYGYEWGVWGIVESCWRDLEELGLLMQQVNLHKGTAVRVNASTPDVELNRMQYLVFDVTPSELPLVVRQPADELLRYGPESRAAILVARATRRDANGQLHPRVDISPYTEQEKMYYAQVSLMLVHLCAWPLSAHPDGRIRLEWPPVGHPEYGVRGKRGWRKYMAQLFAGTTRPKDFPTDCLLFRNEWEYFTSWYPSLIYCKVRPYKPKQVEAANKRKHSAE